MYEEIICALKREFNEKEFNEIKRKQMHLAIFTEPYLSFMLEGKKTIESRFSKHKILPYNNIKEDDIVIIKKSSGDILGYFTIEKVLFFDLEKTSISDIRKNYQDKLCVDASFWDIKKDSRYATLLFIDEIVKLQPFSIHKKGMQSWIKL